MDNNEPLTEGDSDDDNIADLLNQLQMDQSGNSNQVSEGVSGSNRQDVEGVPDTDNINNSGNGAATSPPSDQSATGLNDDVSRGQNSNEQESDDLPDSNENESNYQTASNSRAESELPTGRNQTSQDGSTRQITTVTPSAVINKPSTRNKKSQQIVPRSGRDKPRIDYSQTNKRGMKSTDNPDGFRAMLTNQSIEKRIVSLITASPDASQDHIVMQRVRTLEHSCMCAMNRWYMKAGVHQDACDRVCGPSGGLA